MKIKLKDNVFNVTDRLKKLNPNFFVLYNLENKKFELHSRDYGRLSYVLTFPYDVLDGRAINFVQKCYNSSPVDLNELDKYNKRLTQVQVDKAKDETEYKISKVYDYANKKSNNITENFKNIWI